MNNLEWHAIVFKSLADSEPCVEIGKAAQSNLGHETCDEGGGVSRTHPACQFVMCAQTPVSGSANFPSGLERRLHEPQLPKALRPSLETGSV